MKDILEVDLQNNFFKTYIISFTIYFSKYIFETSFPKPMKCVLERAFHFIFFQLFHSLLECNKGKAMGQFGHLQL